MTYETEFSKGSLDYAYYRMDCAWGHLMRHNFCDYIYAWTVIICNPNLNDKIALAVFCPGAESSSTQEGASTPTTSDPNGTRGHTVEITCHFADGSTKIIRNEQFALASIGGMFGIGGLIGLLISIPLFLLPFILIRRRKGI